MKVYIQKQGKKINNVIEKFSLYAKEKNKDLNIYINYQDYKYINSDKINTDKLFVVFNEKDVFIHHILNVLKHLKTKQVYIKINNQNKKIKLLKKVSHKKLQDIEIIVIDDNNFLPINGRNIINKNNYKDIDMFSTIHGFYPEFGCEHTSCLGNIFMVDESGNISFCYKHESVIGNVYQKEIKSLLEENNLFIEILMKSIERRKECINSNCKYFKLCQGGCIFQDKCCKEFIELYNKNLSYSNEILKGNYNLNEMSLSKENIILHYISKIK